MMRYFKSVIVGLVAAVVAVVMWVAVLVLPVLLPLLLHVTGTGSGGVGFTSDSGSMLAVALVGFLAGFVWNLRSASRLRAHRDRPS